MTTRYHDPEQHAETLLGMLKTDPGIIDAEGLTVSLFSIPQHAAIFQAIDQARSKGGGVTLLTIADELKAMGREDSIALMARVEGVSTANAAYYIRALREERKRRGLALVARSILSGIEDPERAASEIIDEAQRACVTLASDVDAAHGQTTHELLAETIREIEQDIKDKKEGRANTIDTGFPALRHGCGTFRPGEMVIIGARPGSGKTVFSLNAAVNMGRAGIPCVFLNLEMKNSDLGRRILSAESDIHHTRIREGILDSAKDLSRLSLAAARLWEIPVSWHEDDQSINSVRSILRREKAARGIRVAFIDYFGLLSFHEDKRDRWERFAEASKTLKRLALELGLVLFVAVQLSRDAQGREPILSDIRDTGSVEQDADVVMFLHPLEPAAKTSGDSKRRFLAIVAKNRRGPAARVELVLDGPHCRFEAGEPHEEASA